MKTASHLFVFDYMACLTTRRVERAAWGQLSPVCQPLRDGRSTPVNGRAGDAAGTEQMCQLRQAESTQRRYSPPAQQGRAAGVGER
jgi:hypothetical protein